MGLVDADLAASSGLTDALTFNNNAGIYFRSTDAGIHSGDNKSGDNTPTATAARQLSVMPQAVADSTLGYSQQQPSSPLIQTNYTIPIAIAASVLALIALVFSARR